MCEDEFLKELLGQSARAFVILSKIAILGGRFTRLLSHQRCVSMLVTPYFCQHGYLIFFKRFVDDDGISHWSFNLYFLL